MNMYGKSNHIKDERSKEELQLYIAWVCVIALFNVSQLIFSA